MIIAFGIIVRVTQYLYNRSLWLDEVRDVVVNVFMRSFADLFGPPPDLFTPTLPFGFVAIEKYAVNIFGDSELVLRFFPLLAGIVSLFLFYFMAARCIRAKAVPVALILFATLEQLIYYSSEVKPYTGDMAFTILIFLAVLYIGAKKVNLLKAAIFALSGAIIVWFSSPAIFVLAGVGTYLALSSLFQKDWRRLGTLIVIYLVWVLSFASCYYFYLQHLTHNEWLIVSTQAEGYFMPFPPASVSDLKWFMNSFFRAFSETASFYFPSVAAFIFIIGSVAAYSRGKRMFWLLFSPLFFALVASGLGLYPLRDRTLLFMVPTMLLIIAEGTEEVRQRTRNTPFIGVVLITFLLFHPILQATYHLRNPVKVEEIKPVLNYLKKHWQDGDILYLHYYAHPAFTYYSKKYGFGDNDYIVGTYAGEKNDLWAFSEDYLREYTEDLDRLRGNKKVWILFTKTPVLRKGIDDRVFFIYYLNTIGKQLDFYEDVQAAVYLYDLSGETASSGPDQKDFKKKKLHWNF